jgi:hypothetical protein
MNFKLTYKYSTVEMEFDQNDFNNYRAEIVDYMAGAYAALIETVEKGSILAVEAVNGLEQIDKPFKEEKPVESVVEPPKVNTEPGPTEKQIRWARNLGMENPELHTKHEVAKYIEAHR